jgi:hypothetical protein
MEELPAHRQVNNVPSGAFFHLHHHARALMTTYQFTTKHDKALWEQINAATRAAERALVTSTAAEIVNRIAVDRKIPFEQLPADLVQQLRQDGTRDGLRSLEDAENLYNQLPNSLNSIQDVRNVIASANYEGGHIISHSHGGSDTPDNIVYMPTELNRHLGERTPTADELQQARTAVTNEGYLGNSPVFEGIADLAAGATAPLAARITGTGVRLVGGMVRNDQTAINQAFTELPGQLATGATEGLTRGVPAVIGGSILGPVGAVGGMVAADFIEAATTDDESVRFNKCMEGSAKAGVAAVLICNPPLAAIAGTGWLIGKFFNAW